MAACDYCAIRLVSIDVGVAMLVDFRCFRFRKALRRMIARNVNVGSDRAEPYANSHFNLMFDERLSTEQPQAGLVLLRMFYVRPGSRADRWIAVAIQQFS
jgi:hypothetical protein